MVSVISVSPPRCSLPVSHAGASFVVGRPCVRGASARACVLAWQGVRARVCVCAREFTKSLVCVCACACVLCAQIPNPRAGGGDR